MVKAGEVHSSARARAKGPRTFKNSGRFLYLQDLFQFLTADSYMYGPLLRKNGPVNDAEALIRKEVLRKKKLRFTSRNGKLRKVDNLKKALQGSDSTRPFANVEHAVTTPDAHEKSAVRNRDASEVSGPELSATEENSVLEGVEEARLEDSEAEQVVSKLMRKYGGRLSKELGINVDEGDEEVEKWFLAVALFNRGDLSRETLENISNAGINKLVDVVKLSQEELARILEMAGCKSYPERSAARLYRLGVQLETEHGGNVCSLKGLTDLSELNRQLGALFNPTSVRLFLRDLRGVWPSVTSDKNVPAQKAARHLKLNGCNPTNEDERDVEAALTKLASSHSRHYRECPGGTACQMLVQAGNVGE